jgi:hypothetical protein
MSQNMLSPQVPARERHETVFNRAGVLQAIAINNQNRAQIFERVAKSFRRVSLFPS